VATFIASGNVVFRAPQRLAASIPKRVATAILQRHGIRTEAVVRSAAELHAAIDGNPFRNDGSDPQQLYVMFLASEPAAARVAALDPARSAPDVFIVRGREIYLRLPNGSARSKLTNAYFDAKLATTSTSRHWNTVLRLGELLYS
jgi:uncharacterized protein (DUF1697 family)